MVRARFDITKVALQAGKRSRKSLILVYRSVQEGKKLAQLDTSEQSNTQYNTVVYLRAVAGVHYLTAPEIKFELARALGQLLHLYTHECFRDSGGGVLH